MNATKRESNIQPNFALAKEPSSSSSSCCNPLFLTTTNSSHRDSSNTKDYDDADLAREMNELSVEERTKVFEDVHGVADVYKETPEFLSTSIQKFDQALARYPLKWKKNLVQAFFLRPQLEVDQAFKLMFLRADEYNPENAVKRMAKFFDRKLELFGEDRLAKRITIMDLTKKDIDAMRMGYNLVLPQPDQTGRPVIFNATSRVDFQSITIDSLLRVLFYVQSKAAMDTETAQRKGVFVLLCHSVKQRQGLGAIPIKLVAEQVRRSGELVSSIPMRQTSFHYCYDDPQMEFFISAVRMAIGKRGRLRFRAHFGSDMENEYKLMTFGVRCEDLLQRVSAGDSSVIEDYLQHRLTLEKQLDDDEAKEEADTGIVAYPQPNDVLIGRGHAYRDYGGNVRLWNTLIAKYVDDYVNAKDNFTKTCITIEVVKKIRDANGRFLQRLTRRGWKVLDDTSAREKAAIAFRNKAKSPDWVSASGGGMKKAALSSRNGSIMMNGGRDSKRIRYDPLSSGNSSS